MRSLYGSDIARAVRGAEGAQREGSEPAFPPGSAWAARYGGRQCGRAREQGRAEWRGKQKQRQMQMHESRSRGWRTSWQRTRISTCVPALHDVIHRLSHPRRSNQCRAGRGRRPTSAGTALRLLHLSNGSLCRRTCVALPLCPRAQRAAEAAGNAARCRCQTAAAGATPIQDSTVLYTAGRRGPLGPFRPLSASALSASSASSVAVCHPGPAPCPEVPRREVPVSGQQRVRYHRSSQHSALPVLVGELRGPSSSRWRTLRRNAMGISPERWRHSRRWAPRSASGQSCPTKHPRTSASCHYSGRNN